MHQPLDRQNSLLITLAGQHAWFAIRWELPEPQSPLPTTQEELILRVLPVMEYLDLLEMTEDSKGKMIIPVLTIDIDEIGLAEGSHS